MKTLLKTIILFILTITFSYGQTAIDRDFQDKIEYGFSTRWDIEQLLGKGKYLTNKILNPDDEQNLGRNGYVASNGLVYLKSGLTFVCAEDGELITEIRFQNPYKGFIYSKDTIEIGKSELGKLFSGINSFKVTTSIASNYWSFMSNNYMFYIKKSPKDKQDYYFTSYNKNSFKDNLEYYKKQPISIVTISIPDKKKYFEKNEIIKNDLHYVKPMYKPKNETHLNTYRYGWPDNIPSILIPFYAMTGGSKSQQIKEGYWKEYSPKHLIKYEGAYENNEQIGVFKYYDRNGKFVEAKKYSKTYGNWIITSLLLFSLILIIRRRRRRRRKKNVT